MSTGFATYVFRETMVMYGMWYVLKTATGTAKR